MRANFYSQEKPSRGRKPIVQPLWPGHCARGRSPLWVRRLFNHCFHLLGGELAFERRKEREETEKEEEKKGKERQRKEKHGREGWEEREMAKDP